MALDQSVLSRWRWLPSDRSISDRRLSETRRHVDVGPLGILGTDGHAELCSVTGALRI
jgi:hypothetical protein